MIDVAKTRRARQAKPRPLAVQKQNQRRVKGKRAREPQTTFDKGDLSKRLEAVLPEL
jgi:hypothetical protein